MAMVRLFLAYTSNLSYEHGFNFNSQFDRPGASNPNVGRYALDLSVVL